VRPPDENRRRVLQAIARFNEGDLDGYLTCYTETAMIHGLPPGVEASPYGLRAFLETMLTGMPDLHVTVQDSVAEGDRLALRMTYSGTHRAELFGFAPTGARITWGGLTIRRFDHRGLTVERWMCNDSDGLREALAAGGGVTPDPGPD